MAQAAVVNRGGSRRSASASALRTGRRYFVSSAGAPGSLRRLDTLAGEVVVVLANLGARQ
jgi:hypothetical protein